MRIALAAAILALSCGAAAAEFYVVQNTQTRQCSIEQVYPVPASATLLLNNKFMERKDAEAAMKDVPSCN